MERGDKPLLQVRSMSVKLAARSRLISVVENVDLDVFEGKVSGIAGESGSGKTVSMMAILGLLPHGSIVGGHAFYAGQDLLGSSEKRLSKLRGKEIALIMQDPHSSLHPMLSVGMQLSDHVRHHLKMSRKDARGHSIDLLRQVHIPNPATSFTAYPHQFSGGMRQRISIAIALACNPRVIIADEPTTGLDVTVQAGILHLLRELGQRRGLAILLITHDLGVMSAVADHVTIMYAGRVVETGTAEEVIRSPRHPYTAALLAALPHPERPDSELVPIPGHLAPPGLRPSGCAFHARCQYAKSECSSVVPDLVELRPGRSHACLVDPFREAP